MFTGLVDDVGEVTEVRTSAVGRELVIRTRYADLAMGESIACSGACLTVLDHGAGWFRVAAVDTTRGRTAIDGWRVGTRVNLERALSVGDRLGGHLVLGHVDGVGEVTAVVVQGDALLIDIRVPTDVDELLVPHGSVTVDGVSLTVNALPAPRVLQVSIIEHTRRHTTLGERRPGDRVHLEADVLGKYVRRLLQRPPGD
ncbi:MAG: riboflavin synthase [Gemmatimonadaceae bacterium]|nr:riboflavin synthase [Gemmatimonadaceae bacterium]